MRYAVLLVGLFSTHCSDSGSSDLTDSEVEAADTAGGEERDADRGSEEVEACLEPQVLEPFVSEVGEIPSGQTGCGFLRIVAAEGRVVEGPGQLSLGIEISGANGTWNDEDATTSWYARGPAGASMRFEPSAFDDHVRLITDVPGVYQVRAESVNHERGEDCVVQDYKGIVGKAVGLQIELTWDTPGDPDQTNVGIEGNWIVGTDLDLHLLHPSAEGVFGDPEYDCSSGMPSPEWGAPGLANDPELVIDDIDGAGPEVLVVPTPEACATYTIGVYYLPHFQFGPSFGPSFATVRIFLNGELRDQWGGVKLNEGELWQSYTVGPGGEVVRVSPQEPVVLQFPPAP